MPQVDAVWNHPVYQERYRALQRAERDRAFCGHDLQHFLDVARIAWTVLLERGVAAPYAAALPEDDAADGGAMVVDTAADAHCPKVARDVVYAAALLHEWGGPIDETGKPHDIAGPRIAAEILGTVEQDKRFSSGECEQILAAIAHHRASAGCACGASAEGVSGAGALADALRYADKAARLLCVPGPRALQLAGRRISRFRGREAIAMSEKKLTESIADDRGVLARRDGSGLPARRGALAHVSAEQIALADKIFIEGLEVFNHGVYEEENKLGQKFVISATLYCDTRRAGQTDDLDASIDYGAVCHDIDGFLRDHTFKLVERMAESLAEHCWTAIHSFWACVCASRSPGPRWACRCARWAWRSSACASRRARA